MGPEEIRRLLTALLESSGAAWEQADGWICFRLSKDGAVWDMACRCLTGRMMAYGRLPLMITENCLVQNHTGCRLDRGGPAVPDGAPCRSPHELRDRTGAAFPLLGAYGHRTEIQNSRPLYLADRPAYRQLGLTFARLRFTTESPEECVRIFRAYREGQTPDFPFTRGLYERGVQ